MIIQIIKILDSTNWRCFKKKTFYNISKKQKVFLRNSLKETKNKKDLDKRILLSL